MKIQSIMGTVLTLALSIAIGAGCKKNENDDDDDETASGTTGVFSGGGAVGDGTSLAAVYPGELALAVFTTDSGTALRLQGEEAAADEAKRPIKERAAEEEKIASGQAVSCFSPALSRLGPPDGGEDCYEFDQDMVLGGKGTEAIRGTKNGLNSAGEACLVAYAKNRAASINDLLDKAKGTIAMMLCQAKKSDPSITLPATVGQQLDLKTVLTEAFSGKGVSAIDTAMLERLADDADGNPVFRSSVKMTHGDSSRTILLAHVPSLTEAESYYGSMTIIHERDGGDGKKMIMTVVYAKVMQADGSYRMSAELRRAAVAPELVATAIGSDGQLDFNAHRDFSAAEDSPSYGQAKKADGSFYEHNSDFTGQTLITFQVNPDTDEGAFTYWQNPGSNYGEAARGMIAEVAIVDGVKKGCATSGAALQSANLGKGYSIASSIKDGVSMAPNGFYHPFYADQDCTITTGTDADGDFKTCTKNDALIKWYIPQIADQTLAGEFVTDQRGGIVTRQCYKYDETAAQYIIDTAEISETAGFELFRNTDTAKFVAPPTLEGVKPLEGGQVKPE